jgi:carbonic anhydrase
MRVLKSIFSENRKWAENTKKSNPDFFTNLAKQQTPAYLWIGCSDSRVPANTITGLQPGDIFVHRNIANVVIHTDLNCLSVLQYAVDVLKIRHIIVCGHYGCGGIKAAMGNRPFGLIDNWLRHIKDIYRSHEAELTAVADEQKRFDRLCELNVIEQVEHVCHTTIVQNAWRLGRELSVHGWIYGIEDGILRDLDVCITGLEEISHIHKMG